MSNVMRTLFVGLFGFIIIVSLLSTCSRSRSGNYNTVETRTIMPSASLVTAAEQFDLRVLERLIAESTDAADLERRLNQDSPRRHNLDLDENGVVDYIQVSEYGSGNARGLSLFVQIPSTDGSIETQELATIEIERESSGARYQVHGNSSIYGHNHYYHSRTGLGDILLMSWLFSSHNRYTSPWGYNRYPDYYNRPAPMPAQQYQRSTGQQVNGSTLTSSSRSQLNSSTLRSPNAGSNATSVRAPLSNPTAAQRSFQARNPSKQVSSGGFGRPSTSTSTPVRSSSSSRSGSFFGGGK